MSIVALWATCLLYIWAVPEVCGLIITQTIFQFETKLSPYSVLRFYDFIFTKDFRRVLTATRSTLYSLTTSKLTSSRIAHHRTTALAPPCITLSIHRSSLNIMCTVFFDVPILEDKICCVNHLSVVNQVHNLIFAITVDLMLNLPQLSSSSSHTPFFQ